MKVLSLTGASTKIGYMFGILQALFKVGNRYDVILCTSATAIIMLHVVSGKWHEVAKLIIGFTNKQIFAGFKPLFNNGFPTPVAFWRFFTGKNSLGKQAGLMQYMLDNISKEMFNNYRYNANAPQILVYVFCAESKQTQLIDISIRTYNGMLNIIEASSNIPIFINPKKINNKYYYDGGSLVANASILFIEENKSKITHLDSVWQRKSIKDTLQDMANVKLVKWIPISIYNYFMKLRIPSESVLVEKYQNALCELYGIKVRNFYSYTEVDTQYDNEAEEKEQDINNGYNNTIEII